MGDTTNTTGTSYLDRQALTLGAVLLSMTDGLLKRRICEAFRLFVDQMKWDEQIDNLPIDLLYQKLHRLLRCLKTRGCSSKEITRYRSYANIIFKDANAIGWRPDAGMSPEWLDLLQKCKTQDCEELVRHFSSLDISPHRVRSSDILAVVDEGVIRREQSSRSASKMHRSFENLLVVNGYVKASSSAIKRADEAGTKTEAFPYPLNEQAEQFFSFLQSELEDQSTGEICPVLHSEAVGPKALRRKKKYKKITIDHLKRDLGQLYSFLVSRGFPPTELREIFTHRNFEGWAADLEVRGYCANSLRQTLAGILTAARQYEPLAGQCGWVSDFLSKAPIVPEIEIARKKAGECKAYSLLEPIPDEIHADLEKIDHKTPLERRARHCTRGPKYEAAWLEMERLLISHLLSLPWYTQNIIGCKLGPTGNIFNEPIDDERHMYLPEWVQKERKQDPAKKFWQYRFGKDETRGGVEIHSIVPIHLVPLLNDFANERRRELVVEGSDPGTLYVNEHGQALSDKALVSMINEITLVYAGFRTSPKEIRDSFGFEYERDHPNDYPGLAILFWYQDPEVAKRMFDVGRKQSRVTDDIEDFYATMCAKAARPESGQAEST